jgi:hypothetical protein
MIFMPEVDADGSAPCLRLRAFANGRVDAETAFEVTDSGPAVPPEMIFLVIHHIP